MLRAALSCVWSIVCNYLILRVTTLVVSVRGGQLVVVLGQAVNNAGCEVEKNTQRVQILT